MPPPPPVFVFIFVVFESEMGKSNPTVGAFGEGLGGGLEVPRGGRRYEGEVRCRLAHLMTRGDRQATIRTDDERRRTTIDPSSPPQCAHTAGGDSPVAIHPSTH